MAAETERSRRRTPTAGVGSGNDTSKGGRSTRANRKSAAAASTSSEDRVSRLETLVADITAERDRLKAELARAEARLAALEAQNRAAIDRIDWVIDTLETALDE